MLINLPKKINHKIIFDRIEAGTYLIAGALIGKKIVIKRIEPKIFKNEINILKKMGVNISMRKNSISISKTHNLKKLVFLQNPILVFQQTYKLSLWF